MRARRFLFGLFLLMAGAARADQAADVARIHLEVIGGTERIAAIHAMRMSGFVVVGTKRVRFTMIAARPDRVRLETDGGGRSLVNASDGVEPPWEFDTGTWPPRYKNMEESAAKMFTADAEFDDPLVAGRARGYALDYAGETEVDGRKLLRVLVTKRMAESYSLLLDPETYFIVLRVEQRTGVGGRKRTIVTRYDDFRPIDGVLLAHKITLITDGKVEQQMVMEKIETNPEVTDETFTRPKVAVPGLK